MSPELIFDIRYQIGQLDRTIDSLKDILARSTDLSREQAVLSAVAIHSFYNGIEGCLRMMCNGCGIPLPAGERWHAELLELSVESRIISPEAAGTLRPLMSFRHVFRHSYFFDLDPKRVTELGQTAYLVWPILRIQFIEFIGER